jgi:pimeloyl-ACP methyl ester carboxylesterase
MKKYTLLLSCLFLISCKSDALKPGEDPIEKVGSNCASETTDNVKWDYCMYRYSSSSQNVMFYFHGLGGNAKSWDEGQLEQKMLASWEQAGITPPLVISVSFGPTWFLADKNSSPQSGLYPFFMLRVLPFFEDKLINVNVDKTYLLGVSMGGFNAAQLYLRNPNLFSRVALLCPAMSTLSPQASDAEIQNFIALTGADPELVAKTVYLGKMFFPTAQDWQKNSPNVLAEKFLNSSYPPAYIANGMNDPYGFYPANNQFFSSAVNHGAPITRNFYPGAGHCEINADLAAHALIPE